MYHLTKEKEFVSEGYDFHTPNLEGKNGVLYVFKYLAGDKY